MVPSTDRLPNRSRLSSNSLVGPGKSSWLRVRRGSPARAASCSSVSSVVRGLACRPCRALVRNGSGQPPGGSPSSPSRKPITESGMSYFVGFSSKSAGSAPAPTRARARSPTTLDDGVTLTRLPEDAVRRRVHVLDVLEPVAEAEGDGLLAQVRQLAAGDLVEVDAPGGGGQPRLEGLVERAHGLPVGLEREHLVDVEAGRALGAVGGGDQRRQAGLARRAGHRRAGGVDGIHPGVDRGEQRADLAAGGVVGVQVHGQVEVLAQRRDQPGRGRRAQQPGHVLDGEHVRAGVDDLLGQAQVVVEGVELLARVEQVAGVAQGHLGDGGAGVEHGLDGRAHLRDVVERVEDAEDVEPGAGRLVHERVGDLGGVRGVADGVAARAAASAAGCWASPRAAGPAAPTGPRTGSAARRRRWHRPTPPSRAARGSAARRARRRAAGRGCASGWRAGSGGRRGRWCR